MMLSQFSLMAMVLMWIVTAVSSSKIDDGIKHCYIIIFIHNGSSNLYDHY